VSCSSSTMSRRGGYAARCLKAQVSDSRRHTHTAPHLILDTVLHQPHRQPALWLHIHRVAQHRRGAWFTAAAAAAAAAAIACPFQARLAIPTPTCPHASLPICCLAVLVGLHAPDAAELLWLVDWCVWCCYKVCGCAPNSAWMILSAWQFGRLVAAPWSAGESAQAGRQAEQEGGPGCLGACACEARHVAAHVQALTCPGSFLSSQ